MIKKQSLQELKESFFLDELVLQRVEFLKQVYPKFKFNLDLKSTKIVCDRTGLSKVIDNLIDNGVKYSPNSNICDITLKNHTLYIKDYGCGMDEVELLKIFDRYYQSNEEMQGFGIGLSIVKRFCDTNSIDLKFISKPKEGTTVLLKFKEN
jgi:signal transduction histidine kinase